jgi:hypothetical protein
MDPLSLASAAVALLAPYLGQAASSAASKLGQEAVEALRSLHSWVQARFHRERTAGQALQQLEENPQEPRAQGAVEFALARVIEEDPRLAEELKGLVDAAQRAVQVSSVQIEGSGATAVQGDVNLRGVNVAGRDLSIGSQHAVPDPADER